MFKRFVALSCTAMVCAVMFVGASGCNEKKPAPPVAPPAGDPPPDEPGK